MDGLEASLAPGEKAVALVENAFSRVSIERGQQARAYAILIFRGRSFFAKTSKPLGVEFSFGGERAKIALLATLAVGRALDDPGVFHESAEQRIDDVVVHVVVAQQEARAF